jgi:hypothetical protein
MMTGAGQTRVVTGPTGRVVEVNVPQPNFTQQSFPPSGPQYGGSIYQQHNMNQNNIPPFVAGVNNHHTSHV